MVDLWCFDGRFWASKIFHFFEIYFLGRRERCPFGQMRGSFTAFQDDNFPDDLRFSRRPLDGLGFSALIGGGEFAEAGYGGGDDFEGFVDLFGGGEAGEGEADAGSGAGGCEAHCGEHV
jgi:hypothetical protein